MSWSSIASPDASASINNIGTPYEHGIEMALSADGTTGVIAWITGASGSEICKASRLVNGTWTAPENVVTGIGAGAGVAGVHIDGLGKPLVVVRRDNVNLATLHRWDNGWGQIGPEFARSDANGGIYAITAAQPVPMSMVTLGTATRDVILMFAGNGGVRVRRNINGGWAGDWPLLPGMATGGTLGALHRTSGGTLHAVTRYADDRMVHHTSTDNGVNWTSGTIISDADTKGTHVRSTMFSATSILAVWSTTGGNTAWSIYNGTSWSAPALVSGPTAAFASGNVQFAGDTLTYGKSVNGVTQIFARRFYNGAWGNERQVTNSATSVTIHTLGCTADGVECFVAYSSSSTQELTTVRRVNGNWYDPQSKSETGFYPQAYVNGQAIAMFSGDSLGISLLDTSAARQMSGRAQVFGTETTLALASKRNMTSATDATETAIGDALLRAQPLTGAAQLYLALFTEYPGESGSTVAEVTGGGYSRKAVSFGPASPDGTFANDEACIFSPATASWGTVSFMGLMTDPVAGEMVLAFPLIDANGEPTTQAIGVGDRPEIAVGDLTIEIN